MNLPVIRIELERVSQQVGAMLQDHNNELNEYVKHSIDQQLKAEWVMQQIDIEVKKAIQKAIEGVSSNWKLQDAITSAIAETIAQKFKERSK